MTHLSEILGGNAEQFFSRAPHPSSTLVASVLPAPAPSPPLLNTDRLLSELHDLRSRIDTIVALLSGTAVTSRRASDQSQTAIEGVFNGEHMIGADGQEYPVSANYASKSKLVEGDLMNVRAGADGRHIFKQIQVTDRMRLSGVLRYDSEARHWYADANGRRYKILTASITFYRAAAGHTAYFLVPKSGESTWGAMDGVRHSIT